MSRLVQLLRGAAKSNTVQFNGIFLAILAGLLNTDFVKANPDATQIIMGIQAIVNLLLRLKTSKPLAER